MTSASSKKASASGLVWLWLTALVIVLDQLTKYYASLHLTLGDPVPVMPFFNLTLIHNTGAAFGLLSERAAMARWLFSSLAVLVSGVLIYWMRRIKHDPWMSAAFALILGGALANLTTRIIHGYVIDFIDLYVGQWHWPAFNVADAAIVLGTVIVLWDAMRGR